MDPFTTTIDTATIDREPLTKKPDVAQLNADCLGVLWELAPGKTSLHCAPGARPKGYIQRMIAAGVLSWDGFQIDLTDVGKVLVERVTGAKFQQEFDQGVLERADMAMEKLRDSPTVEPCDPLPPEPNLASLRADVATVLRVIVADASTWTLDQALAAKRVLWWAAKQLGNADGNVDDPPVDAEEQPLDFAALRKAVETLAKFRFTSFLVWTDEACVALDTLSESAPRLIAMSERGEKLAADVRIERQRFMAISAEDSRTNEQLGAALNRAEAERDRLKTQLAEVTTQRELVIAGRNHYANKAIAFEDEAVKLRAQLAGMTVSREYAEQHLVAIESQPSGLSEEEYLSDAADTLRNIIDRLKRQKAVPWKKIRRVEKSGYYFWGSESEAHWGYLNAGSEASEPVYHVSFDDVLATLPKGDVTP
jgi:hypothetical protein